MLRQCSFMWLVLVLLLIFCCSELECIDVTVPVQSMVKNSQLIVPAGTQLVRKFNLRYIITVCEINTTTTVIAHVTADVSGRSCTVSQHQHIMFWTPLILHLTASYHDSARGSASVHFPMLVLPPGTHCLAISTLADPVRFLKLLKCHYFSVAFYVYQLFFFVFYRISWMYVLFL